MEDPVYRQLFLDYQRFNDSIGSSNPHQYSPPSTAYRNHDDSIITSYGEWPSPSEGRNSIPSFEGLGHLTGETAGEYGIASTAPQTSTSQGHASATPRSSNSSNAAPFQPEPESQPSVLSPESHQAEERHAAEWDSEDDIVLRGMHRGKHARSAMARIRRDLCRKLGIAMVDFKSWSLSKRIKRIKKRLVPDQVSLIAALPLGIGAE